MEATSQWIQTQAWKILTEALGQVADRVWIKVRLFLARVDHFQNSFRDVMLHPAHQACRINSLTDD